MSRIIVHHLCRYCNLNHLVQSAPTPISGFSADLDRYGIEAKLQGGQRLFLLCQSKVQSQSSNSLYN